MYYIIYLSAGIKWFSERELKDVLAISILNNRANHVTGMLLYSEGNFIQFLEGKKNDVQETFQKISKDHRHGGVTHIASGTMNDRKFPDWAMGFKSINATSLAMFEGYFNPQNEKLPANNDGHLGTTLLKAFIRKARMTPDTGDKPLA